MKDSNTENPRKHRFPQPLESRLRAIPPEVSGIYGILHVPTLCFLVGCALEISTRTRDHFDELRREKHKNAALQRAWDNEKRNNLHAKNFHVVVLEPLDRMDRTLEREDIWITRLNSLRPGGFNGRLNKNTTVSGVLLKAWRGRL
jgi:hypothetical protein